jgi:hypothetical protein
MTYELKENNGLPYIVVNNNIFFAWDPNDIDNYGVFMQKLEEKGIEIFAQLLAEDTNTAFITFING